jgi:uncharacterized protein
MKIGISGGTGLIGTKLTQALLERSDEVFIFTRNNNPKRISESKLLHYISTKSIESSDLEGLNVLVNLAGENIAGVRWTDSAKEKFYKSRVDHTKNIVDAINSCKNPPALLLNASAIGFYGSYPDSKLEFNEDSPQGKDYLGKLCANWEAATSGINNKKTKVILARIGIVLDTQGGALAKLVPIFKSFIGGPIASGEQGMSWIHSQDIVRAFIFLMEKNRKNSVFNLTAPKPRSNYQFSKSLGKALQRPAIFPTPSFALDAIFGEGSIVVTQGQFVLPENLQAEGFEFQFPELDLALENLLQ